MTVNDPLPPLLKARLLVALLLSSSACSAATRLECPEELKDMSQVEAPTGWEIIAPRYGPKFDGITIYEGHPREMASQVPDELPAKNGFEISRWPVGPNTWLECRYRGTNSTIARPLPKGLSECKAYYKHIQHGLGPLDLIECK